MPTSSSAGEYLNILLYHRYNKLLQHSSFCYITHRSTWQLYLSRRLALILHTFILYSIITSYFQGLVSGFICYHGVSFEIAMISLPPKLHYQILLHVLVSFTKSCDISWNCTACWGLGFLAGLGQAFFPSQRHSYFGKARHKRQTVLNTVLTVHGMRLVLVKLLRHECLCSVSSGSTNTLTDGKSDTYGCE